MSVSGGPPAGYRPAYASQVNAYLASRNLYNGKATTMLKTRSSLMRASSAALGQWAVIGQSLDTGYVGAGTNTDPELGWPAKLLATLVNLGIGVAHGGAGIRPSAMVASGTTSGFTYGGLFGAANAAYGFTTTTGTCTYMSPQAGTIVTVQVWNNGASGITWTIDGNAQAPITTDATATWKQVQVTGLPNTVHTVVLTSPGAPGMFVGHVAVTQASGLIIHNLAMSGARAASGSATFNWTSSLAVHGNMVAQRIDALTAFLAGAALDAVFIDLDINGILAGDSAATCAAGVATILGYPVLAGADVYLIGSWRATGPTDAAWNAFLTALYARADLNGANLIDWNDRVGGHDAALANGILGADGIHGTAGAYAMFGKALADMFLS